MMTVTVTKNIFDDDDKKIIVYKPGDQVIIEKDENGNFNVRKQGSYMVYTASNAFLSEVVNNKELFMAIMKL